jgi:hypothetical protein
MRTVCAQHARALAAKLRPSRWPTVRLPLGPPAACALEALVRDALAVTADVVDGARQGQRCNECFSGIGNVQGGAVAGVRQLVACAGAVEEAEAQNDSAPARGREANGLLLGHQRRAQVLRHLAERRLLVDEAVRRVEEGDAGLNVRLGLRCKRGVDKEPRRLRS